MSVTIGVEGVVQFTDKLKKAGREMEADTQIRTERACLFLMNWIQFKKLRGQVLNRRTGRLADTAEYHIQKKDRIVSGHVGFKQPYATIHEKGGTIQAKYAEYLTMPLPRALTPAGVVKKPATDWEDTFVQKSKKGNLIIFQKSGRNIIPLFVLKRKVKIPKRPYIAPSLKETKNIINEIVGETIKMGVKIVNGQ